MKKVKILIITILALSAISELTLRTTRTLGRFRRPQYALDEELMYRYNPNTIDSMITPAFTNKYGINSSGFNWDEFELKKKTGVFRIVLIGSSDDVGINTNGPNSYARLLQKTFLNNKDSIEIMNLSIDGNDRTIAQLKLAVSSIKYKPDLVLMNFDFPIIEKNEFRTTYKGFQIKSGSFNQSLEKEKRYIDENFKETSYFIRFYELSHTFRYFCKFFAEQKSNSFRKFIKDNFLKENHVIERYVFGTLENKEGKRIGRKSYSLEETISLFQKVNDSLKVEKIKLFLFNTYGSNKLINQFIECNKLNHLSLDIVKKPEYSFGIIDDHSTQKGHQAIADKFYLNLFRNEIIPGKYFSVESKKRLLETENLTLDEDSIVSDSILLKDFNKRKSGNMSNQKGYKVLFITNEFYEGVYKQFFNSIQEFGYSQMIEVLKKDQKATPKVSEFLELIDQYFVEYNPHIIICSAPNELIGNDISVIEKLKQYQDHLSLYGCDLIFINFSIGTEQLVINSLLNSSKLKSLYTGLSFTSREIKKFQSKLVNVESRRLGDLIYSSIIEEVIPNRYQANISNLTSYEKLWTSSNQKESNYLVDHIKFNSDFYMGWSSTDSLELDHQEWIILKLKNTQELSTINLYPRNDLEYPGRSFPKDLKVYASVDSLVWSRILTKSLKKEDGIEVYHLNDMNTRYVKIEANKLNSYSDSGNLTYKMTISEIEIYETNTGVN